LEIITELSKTVIGLPKNEREYYRKTVNDTFLLLDSAITIVVNRLGNILSYPPSELYHLNEFREWEEIGRKVSLCHSLRSAGREMDSIIGKLTGRLSLQNEELHSLIKTVIEGEGGFAMFISNSLSDLTDMAYEVSSSKKSYDDARNTTSYYRNWIRQYLYS
jgi:hypothetical protein